MSSRSSFQVLSSSIKVEEEAPKVTIEKQGIVSILGSDYDKTKPAAAASLRRTLSADMSSKKWLAQNGLSSFSPMKKIASSEEIATAAANHHHSSSSSFSSSSSSSEGEEDLDELKRPGQDDVWRSIQSQKEKKCDQNDVWSWSSILLQKNEEDSSKLPPPYIHPLVRRSGSTLSEKSLEICTESLGSETGSDGFSSYSPSELGDVDEIKDNDQQQPQLQKLSQSPYEDMRVVKYNYSTCRQKMVPRSFPPPLPSLAREDRAYIHSYRESGRLVLESVFVPPQNYFQIQREDGCLRLTFINTPSQKEETEDDVQDFERLFDNFEEVEENEAKFDEGYEVEDIEEEVEEEEEEDGKNYGGEKGKRNQVEFVMELQQNTKLPSGGLMDVHKPTLVMTKLMGLDKKNLAWAPRFNRAVNLMWVEEEEMVVGVEDELLTPPLPQSLPVPPPPRVARLISAPPASTAAAASFNAYEYFWKEKSTMASIIKPINMSTTEKCQQPLKNNQNNVILASNLNLMKGYEQQNLVLMRENKAEYLVPLLRRCKESRARSLLLWEPYCIATS